MAIYSILGTYKLLGQEARNMSGGVNRAGPQIAACSTFAFFGKSPSLQVANMREVCDEHTDPGVEGLPQMPLFVEQDGPSGPHGQGRQTATPSAPSPYTERYDVVARQHVSRHTNHPDNKLEPMELDHLGPEDAYFILGSLGQRSPSGGDHPTPGESQSNQCCKRYALAVHPELLQQIALP